MSDGRTWGTIIGGVVGYFTGGIGFAAGAAIGGAVGSLLEPKKHTETNRIDDIKVSISKYGDGIPETWGNNIPSATCVWSTYIIELPEESQGGKGGGVENTNYRQFIQSMWCLGRTPPPGTTVTIRKVWIDGKLNYDSSNGMPVDQALATKENPWASIAILPGFDGQLPVPMIETYEGVGNVPAFTGRICVFIFGLETPGGRVPQLQFELCMNSTLETAKQRIQTLPDDRDTFQTVTGFVQRDGTATHVRLPLYGDPNLNRYHVYAVGAGYAELSATRETSHPPDTTAPSRFIPVVGGAPALLQMAYESEDDQAGDLLTIRHIDLESGVIKSLGTFIPPADTMYAYKWAAFDPATDVHIVVPEVLSPIPGLVKCQGGTVTIIDKPSTGFGPVAAYGGTIHVLDSTGVYVTSMDEVLGTEVDSLALPGALPVTSVSILAMHASGDGVFALSIGLGGGDTTGIYQRGSSGYVLVSDDVVIPNAISSGPADPRMYTTFYADAQGAILGPNLLDDGTFSYDLIRFNALTLSQAPVAGFIENQNLRAGLAVDQIDVASIDDEFWGLTLKGPASARSNITPVMTYSAIGVVEEDGKLKYFHRADRASVVTIPYDDLGFAEDGSEPGDPFPVLHSNAQELPRSITLTYNDPNFDYQASTVKAFMLSAVTGGDESQTLDMAVTGGRAQTIVRRLLLERWIAQNTRSCAVSRAYAYLSAGDVITVLSRTGSYGDWMISKLTDTGARIEIECFPADSDLLIQVVPGPGGYRAQTIDPLAPPTRMQILDMPNPLQDSTTGAGPFVAFDTYGGGAANAELLIGSSDADLTPQGTVSASAPIGLAETALGDWTRNLVDETNIFTVNLGDDEFTGGTRDQLLAGQLEYWACGAPGRWEIGSSAIGDDLGSGRYILSRHLRGQFGTEMHTGTHEVGDTFVLLRRAGILRPDTGVGSIGQDKKYRAVTKGRSRNSAASQTYANTGEVLRPLAPVNLRRSNTNDLSVDRRSRLAMNNSSGSLPLGEATEAYSWSFYTSAAFTTLIGTVATTTATVTAAQITSAGATPSGPLYVRVRQLSDSVGAGHDLQATA